MPPAREVFVSRRAALWPSLHSVLFHTPGSLEELSAAIQAELSALRNIDAFYQSKRQCLEIWSGPQADKDRHLAQMELCWKTARDRHTRQLTDLRERLESLTNVQEDVKIH